MAGRREGEQGVKRGWNSEDATCWGTGKPRGIRLLCAGVRCRERNPMRGTAPTENGHADVGGAGGISGNTLRKSESPGVDGLGILKRMPSARCNEDASRVRSARTKTEEECGEPNTLLCSSTDKNTEGPHNFERGGRVDGNAHPTAGRSPLPTSEGENHVDTVRGP